MIEIKNIVKTLSPERNPSTRLKTDNLRYSAFSAEPRSVTYDKVRALARTRREKHNLIEFSPLNDRDRECAFSAVFALSKTKKQGEFLKYQELTRVFLEISLKNKQ